MALTHKQKFNKKHGQPLNQSNSIKKIAELSKISERQAKKIYKKGAGAYFSASYSVRQSVSTPEQWGMGRLYSAVGKGRAKEVDKSELIKGRKEYLQKKNKK